MNYPSPPWGGFAAFRDKCPGEGGGGRLMGTLGIAWTIIDQAEGQHGWILAKFVCPFLSWTKTRPIDSHLDRICLVNKRHGLGLKLLTLGVGDSLLLPLTSIPEKENNGSKRLSPTPSVSNLSLRPCRYLSTVTRSSGRASVDGFRRERLQRFATFDSLSVQRSLEAR